MIITLKTTNDIETFNGLISTTTDALRVFDLSRKNLLPRVRRRFTDSERVKIRSGSVFIFEEEESGIRRWTDGRLWSPSRILGNFLIYREIEKCHNNSYLKNGRDGGGGGGNIQEPQPIDDHISSLLGGGKSKKINYKYGNTIPKPNGLLKKTISAKIDGMVHHLIAYFDENDFIVSHNGEMNGNNQRDTFINTTMNELRKIPLPTDLLLEQTFRKSPLIANGTDSKIKIAPKNEEIIGGRGGGFEEEGEEGEEEYNDEYEITNSITNYYKHPFNETTILQEENSYDDDGCCCDYTKGSEYPFLTEIDPILPNYFKD